MMNLMDGKIRLRAVEPVDAALMYEWENDRALWYVSGTTSPLPMFIIDAFVKEAYQDIHINKQLRLIIERCDISLTLGYVDLFDVDFINRRAGVGIVIGDPAQRNNGFGSKAIHLVKKYAFEVLNLHQLFCNIHELNKPSIILFEKAGFVKCGLYKEWALINGQYQDVLPYQCLNEKAI